LKTSKMAYITISDLNRYLKAIIEKDTHLKNMQVVGEISNLKFHQSGHIYFTLKDETSRINAVMFASYASRLKIKVSDGMKVVVSASIGVYEQGGSYQLYVQSIETIGTGNLFLQFEQLKKQLFDEGLFDDIHKVTIPKFPMNIGIISAPSGAAVHDIITTINRRWPIAKITLIPSLVQGKEAANEIVEKLKLSDTRNFDVVILARGGGSIEDLWCFNEEIVARAIYNMKTPIISAIGHEVDFTIADFVADMRAPTPTGAAEIATPSAEELHLSLVQTRSRLSNDFYQNIGNVRQKLSKISQSVVFTQPEYIYANRQLFLDNIYARLINVEQINFNKASILLQNYRNTFRNDVVINLHNYSKRIVDYKNKIRTTYSDVYNKVKYRFVPIIGQLDALSPLKVMSRGYSIVKIKNKVVVSVDEIKINDIINIKMYDGEAKANVIEKNKE